MTDNHDRIWHSKLSKARTVLLQTEEVQSITISGVVQFVFCMVNLKGQTVFSIKATLVVNLVLAATLLNCGTYSSFQSGRDFLPLVSSPSAILQSKIGTKEKIAVCFGATVKEEEYRTAGKGVRWSIKVTADTKLHEIMTAFRRWSLTTEKRSNHNKSTKLLKSDMM